MKFLLCSNALQCTAKKKKKEILNPDWELILANHPEDSQPPKGEEKIIKKKKKKKNSDSILQINELDIYGVATLRF